MESVLRVVVFLAGLISVFGQESIDVHKDMNVGMHAGIALVICFGILASCAIGVNVITRMCAKRLGIH